MSPSWPAAVPALDAVGALGTPGSPGGLDAQDASGEAGRVYGLLGLGGIDIAIPLSALEEVVRCPLELHPLPAQAPGLLGALPLRSMVLPILDLRPGLGLPAPRTAEQMVVVVVHEHRSVGLLVDDVRGVSRIPDHSLVPVQVATGRLDFSHLFTDPDTARPISVLDAAALLERPTLPTVAAVERASQLKPVTRADAGPLGAAHHRTTVRGEHGTRTVIVVGCGPHRLGIDITRVRTTVSEPTLQPSPLISDSCLGVLDFSGSQLPVVDPLAVLGIGHLATDDLANGVVLDLGTGSIVLAVSSLITLTEITHDDVLHVPAFASPRPDLLAGIIDVPAMGSSSQVLLLDDQCWAGEETLVALAALNTAASETATHDADTRRNASGEPHIVFCAGTEMTAPLADIAEILPMPTDLVAVTDNGASRGILVHRGTAIPVVDLGVLLGQTSTDTGDSIECLLLVNVTATARTEQVAFAIESLGSIQPLTWTDPQQHRRGDSTDLTCVIEHAPVVHVGDDPRLLPTLQLSAIAATLLGYSEQLGARPVETSARIVPADTMTPEVHPQLVELAS